MSARPTLAALTCAALCLAAFARAQESKPTDVTITSHVYEPAELEPTDARLRALKLPKGFKIAKFAEGLEEPRIIAVSEDGTVYVSERRPGKLIMLKDADGDGKAEVRQEVASKDDLHGVAIRGSKIYLATVKEVLVADLQPDGTLGALQQIIGDLPDGGQHPNRTLAFGPDGKLYITVGSTCNACAETNPESATVLVADADGANRSIFARGLRNTIGLDWHPQTGALYAMDHGIDWLGDNEQKEELNLLLEGKQYGWPYIYADGKKNPQDEPPPPLTMEDWRKLSIEPVLLHDAHSAPMQFLFYDGTQFPEAYRNSAFLTLHGSWNRKPPSGYEVVQVVFDEAGKPMAFKPFLSGFLVKQGKDFAYFGRPVGLAIAKNGSLLVGDDSKGVIYRVSYAGN